MYKFILLPLIGLISSATAKVDLDCSVRVGVGALSALAEIDYKEFKKDFYECPALIDAVRALYSKNENLGFKFESSGPSELISNLKVVSGIA